MKELEKRYGATKSYTSVLLEVFAMRRLPHQSLHDFASAIRAVCLQAQMPEEERNQIARQAFMLGLTDYPAMRSYIERKDKQKNSLITVVDLAIEYERDRGMESSSRVVADVGADPMEDTENAVNRFFQGRFRQPNADLSQLFQEMQQIRTLLSSLQLQRQQMPQPMMTQQQYPQQRYQQRYPFPGGNQNYRSQTRVRNIITRSMVRAEMEESTTITDLVRVLWSASL